MKNLLLLFTLILMVGFSSCSDKSQLDVSADDLQSLQIYVDEANALVDVAHEIEGNVGTIFSSTFIINACGNNVQFINGGVADEATLLLNDMIDKMGFESALAAHDWMVDAGRIMYDIKQENKKNFNNDNEIMAELACMVSPEIRTRNGSTECYKDNLVALFVGTLDAGSNYGTRIASTGKKDISEAGCSARGSSFNKIWLFMKNNIECN